MMNKNKILFLLFLIIIVAAAYILIFTGTEENLQPAISVSKAMSSSRDSGYAKAIESREFTFPDDHGPHNDFKLEWWYFTGNLISDDGRLFGYQFTIFRSALNPVKSSIKSELAANQLYFAHFGITDIAGDRHYSFEKFARGADGLAGAAGNPLSINVENWAIKGKYVNQDSSIPQINIKAVNNGISLDITLNPKKGVVLHGNKGLSRKSNEEGIASYYYSLTRLRTDGIIKLHGVNYKISGNSWMDREWSTSTLSKNQTGWDWFSIQLDDTTELMFFRLRDTLNKTDFSRGTYVFADGSYESINPDDIIFRVIDSNKLKNGSVYPSKWSIKLMKYWLELKAETQIPEQEMKLSVKYYEGSIKVTGRKKDKKVSGFGYVELTGYTD